MSFDTPESIAIELETFVMNERSLYPRFQAIIECLTKKHHNGIYEPEKALKIWESWVMQGAKAYMKEFKLLGNIRHTFPKNIRAIVAKNVEEYARKEYLES